MNEVQKEVFYITAIAGMPDKQVIDVVATKRGARKLYNLRLAFEDNTLPELKTTLEEHQSTTRLIEIAVGEVDEYLKNRELEDNEYKRELLKKLNLWDGVGPLPDGLPWKVCPSSYYQR
jgi:hypothetical protein